MKYFFAITTLAFLAGCGDKNEDTGDTGVEDTASVEQ